ncbi:hypothetical protein [Paenarthrobacter ureafaciens]|uniref:hypothetical protein n=1 Tax=Paenarthrobacter ureafaciens TaxID=37931 RepID=UPI0009ACE5CD|nr:hypothetical protein [Paenarthrobacter ureafaciens]GLU58592.1 hypothetical protein Pure01_11050 [Paenarthrobacter ureafaciens]GLU61837.1 hypothetical protein Pure02_00870 [Paenarthrobacter ureafaciens]GLU66111.1 hypothetical protein Pure03_00870 [Paenarthrobacter ureafaciens]GLU71565.1 hypothetical protein Pure04_12800 [Paenarthrobacter ureafaciens]GLU74648.1 hypothetical protein Pure05_00880 [Paenarthrobacter ureafaciens]
MSELRVEIMPDTSGLVQAFERVAEATKQYGRTLQTASEKAGLNLRLAFADTAKERRLILRDYARAHRRPALIHKGKKARR